MNYAVVLAVLAMASGLVIVTVCSLMAFRGALFRRFLKRRRSASFCQVCPIRATIRSAIHGDKEPPKPLTGSGEGHGSCSCS
jgi:hypothetical protein